MIKPETSGGRKWMNGTSAWRRLVSRLVRAWRSEAPCNSACFEKLRAETEWHSFTSPRSPTCNLKRGGGVLTAFLPPLMRLLHRLRQSLADKPKPGRGL
eukprot:5164406-Amphidinium_carterae.1